MWKAEQLANWILVRHSSAMNRDIANDEYITQMKLHKLLYYVQGVYLALFDEKLFDEDMLAWQHGPVVRSIFDKYQGTRELGTTEFDQEQMNDFEEINDDEDARTVLEAVYEQFGKYSAGQLRNMTHSETPWIEAWESGHGTEKISNKLITEYFRENIVEV